MLWSKTEGDGWKADQARMRDGTREAKSRENVEWPVETPKKVLKWQ